MVGGDWEIPAWVLPGPRPTISTGRSMTDTGGTQTLRHADAAGPIAVTTVGEKWFVLTLATPMTTSVVGDEMESLHGCLQGPTHHQYWPLHDNTGGTQT